MIGPSAGCAAGVNAAKSRSIESPGRRGESARDTILRRGSLARGVLYGPKGGRRDTRPDENYYRIPRDESAGPLGRVLRDNSPLIDRAAALYLKLYLRTLAAHGWQVD